MINMKTFWVAVATLAALASMVAGDVTAVAGGTMTPSGKSVPATATVAPAFAYAAPPKYSHSALSSWVRVYEGGTGTDSLIRTTLTPDGDDTYSVVKTGNQISMSAPSSNTGGNRREVFWPSWQGRTTDSRVCASWTADSTFDTQRILQQGLAARITTADGRTRAITVTKNVWGNVGWVFNAHTWDTARGATPFVGIGQWDMAHIVTANGTYQALPWRACIQVIDHVLMFKIWLPALQVEPDWGDTNHVRMTLIPRDFIYPGNSGWYVGHIPPGASAEYRNLEVWNYL